MATKPFKLLTAQPGDTDIVSVFPNLDRGDKDIVQSWLLTDHNVDGTHTQVSLVQVGTLLSDGTTTTVAPTPAASRSAIYRDTDGALKVIRGEDSTVEWLRMPPATVTFDAGTTTPQGALACNGQAVSRTTFARLFARTGTTYGAGDGSTTFNVPDIQGRVVIGRDANAVGRVTVAGGNFDSSVLGTVGGVQNVVLGVTQIPSHTHSGVTGLENQAHTHNYNGTSSGTESQVGGGPSSGIIGTVQVSGNENQNHNHNFTTDGGTGGGLFHINVQPTIVLNAVIWT